MKSFLRAVILLRRQKSPNTNIDADYKYQIDYKISTIASELSPSIWKKPPLLLSYLHFSTGSM